MKIKYYLIGTVAWTIMGSCNEDILELQPLDEYSDAAVWEDPLLAEAVLNGLYKYRDDPFNKFQIGIIYILDKDRVTWF